MDETQVTQRVMAVTIFDPVCLSSQHYFDEYWPEEMLIFTPIRHRPTDAIAERAFTRGDQRF